MILLKKGGIEIGEILFMFLVVCGLVLATYIISTATQDQSIVSLPHKGYRIPPSEVFEYYPDSTLGELLDNGMETCDALFYSETESGDFLLTGYSWTLGDRFSSPDAVPVIEDDIRTSTALFDGNYIPSLRGFAFKVYEQTDDVKPMHVCGLMVFNDDSTKLDEYYSNETSFTVRYHPERGEKRRLESCSVVSSEEMTTLLNNDISIYFFRCSLVWSG